MSTCFRLILVLITVATLAACATGSSAEPTGTPVSAVELPATQTPTTNLRTDPTATVGAPASLPDLILPGTSEELAALAGGIQIDGSSTVFPITEAAAVAFREIAPGVTINLGVSGTGGGFERFCGGETTISDASRPIKADEIAACTANGIGFIELPVAYDGLSLAVNAENRWAQCLTTAELKQIWEPAAEGKVLNWRDIRDDWPNLPLNLYGAGVDSGTFDYFTAAIVGEEGQIRPDYTASEDDYLLAQDLVDDLGGLGFFGYTYVQEYEGDLRAVAIDNGGGCIGPNEESIATGSYQPLSRPLFIYVRADSMEQPEVAAFVDFYLRNSPALVASVRSIPLLPRVYELVLERANERITGSVFEEDVPIGISIEELLVLEGSK